MVEIVLVAKTLSIVNSYAAQMGLRTFLETTVDSMAR